MRAFCSPLFLILAVLCSAPARAACERDAMHQAKKLLTFHMGDGFQDRMSFDAPQRLRSIKNPANPRQHFDVLEIEGYVSPHGQYRMRFIFYRLGTDCVLMGQEILEFADL